MTVAPLRDFGSAGVRDQRASRQIERLLDHSGPELAAEREDAPHLEIFPDLVDLLRLRNGFVSARTAFEVFPLAVASAGPDQVSWNHPDLWRKDYPGLDLSTTHVFGQDAFARQFAIDVSGRVLLLDLETAELELYAATLDEWAWRIERERTESPLGRLAREWGRVNGPLRCGERLAPRIPFALGGDRTMENVESLDCHDALRRATETRERLDRRASIRSASANPAAE